MVPHGGNKGGKTLQCFHAVHLGHQIIIFLGKLYSHSFPTRILGRYAGQHNIYKILHRVNTIFEKCMDDVALLYLPAQTHFLIGGGWKYWNIWMTISASPMMA